MQISVRFKLLVKGLEDLLLLLLDLQSLAIDVLTDQFVIDLVKVLLISAFGHSSQLHLRSKRNQSRLVVLVFLLRSSYEVIIFLTQGLLPDTTLSLVLRLSLRDVIIFPHLTSVHHNLDKFILSLFAQYSGHLLTPAIPSRIQLG